MADNDSILIDSGAVLGQDIVIDPFVRIGRCYIGDNCRLHSYVEVDDYVKIGKNVKIQSHVMVPNGVILEDGVFVGPNVTFTNDKYPRSITPECKLKNALDWNLLCTRIGEGASLGGGSVIVCGVNIGKWAMVGAGAVVTKDVPDYASVTGCPARITGYVDKSGMRQIVTIKYKYQIILLGHPDYAAEAEEVLSEQLEQVGIKKEYLSFIDYSSFSRPNPKAPAIAFYFGYENSHINDDKEQIQELIMQKIPVIPVVLNKKNFKDYIPEVLYPIEAVEAKNYNWLSLADVTLRMFRLSWKQRKVFISYRQKDSTKEAVKLYNILHQYKYNVFLDLCEIEDGTRFQRELEQHLVDSDILVLLNSENIRESPWVAKELLIASERQIAIVEWQMKNCMPMQTGITYPIKVIDDNYSPLIQTIEQCRIRNMQARKSSIVDPLLNLLNKEHVSYDLHVPYIIAFDLKSIMRICLGAMRIPDARMYEDVSIWVKKYFNSKAEIWILYDRLYIKDEWIEHLKWLNEYLPVKSQNIQDINKWFTNL